MSSFIGLLWYVHLVNTLLSIASSAFYYCEAATPSSANLTSTYTIIPSDYGQNFEEVILQSPNGSFQLMFGNLPGQSNPHSLGIVHVVSTTLVWYTYRDNNPGQYDNLGGTSTTLELGKDGNLAIHVTGNGVNILVWKTGTSGMGVVGMALREEGNLVLLNSSKGVVWQSFEHPTDTLLANQKLFVGKSLLVSARNKFPSVGRSILSMESDRLVSYVIYVDPEPYWELSTKDNKELAYASIVNGSISVFDKNGHIVASRGNSSSISGGEGSLQRFILADDGNMRLFKFDNSSSAWIQQMQVIEEACALPDDCGYYGLCIPGQGCACPPTFESLTTLSGCVPARGLVCNSRYGKDFVKVPAASYFAAGLTTIPNLSFAACQSLCTNNCSCLGFFYGVGGGSSRQCLITHQMRTFSASIYGNYTEKYAYDLYVRVQGKPRSPLAIILGVCIPVAVIIISLVLWAYVRYEVKVAHVEEEEFLLEALPGLPPRYSYKELKNATNNFAQRIGGGSFGSVYEGAWADGTRIAVKRLEGALQGKKEFHAEVATIGMVRHMNLVRLRGFCLEKKHRLLVYEHMAKGSLAGLLFGREAGKENLGWEERLAMAIGVARGLAYLHEGSHDCIIHCDIKPENILVGEVGVAKLSDFGLAKLMSREQAYCETNVRGTRGYLAPEWLTGRRQITEKADVYSYGVVLLEILSGRRNFEEEAESGKSYLPEWALHNLAAGGSIEEIVDMNLYGNDMRREEMGRAGMVALWCIQEDPTMRPSMNRVVRMLEGDVAVATPPRPPSDDATVFSTRAFGTERLANSEVTMPFLLRASRFLHLSSPRMPTTASSIS